MFNFFANLAYAIYNGVWGDVPTSSFINEVKTVVSSSFFLNPFNNTGTNTLTLAGHTISYFICSVLSIICCISVFFIIVKAVKKLFTCFLDF